MTKRTGKIGVKAQLYIILRQKALCGCGCGEFLKHGEVEFDHRPPLMFRKRTDDGGYEPAEHDPDYIEALRPVCHKIRTFGEGGDKRITTRGSDIGEAARINRQKRKIEQHRMVMITAGREAEMPKSDAGKPWKWPSRKMESRPFPKKVKP